MIPNSKNIMAVNSQPFIQNEMDENTQTSFEMQCDDYNFTDMVNNKRPATNQFAR